MREMIRKRLKELIIRGLRIEDMTPDQLADDEPLLSGQLNIDSLDVLQLILEIERSFSIKLVTGEFVRSQWETIDTLAATIESKLPSDGVAEVAARSADGA
jgi:acyl carrier protein